MSKVLSPAQVAEILAPYAADETRVAWRDGLLCVGNSRVFPLATLGAKAKNDIPSLAESHEALRADGEAGVKTERRMWVNAVQIVMDSPDELDLIGHDDSIVRGALLPIARMRGALAAAEAKLNSARETLARYGNPWTVQIQSTNGHWSEFCHDAPITLQEGERRVDEINADHPRAVVRVVPWLNASQQQHVRESTEALRADRDNIAEALERGRNREAEWEIGMDELRADNAALRAKVAELEQDNRNLRKHYHLASGHNQWFERCESEVCCPERYQDPVLPVKSVGEMLSIEDTGERIAQLEAQLTEQKEGYELSLRSFAEHHVAETDGLRAELAGAREAGAANLLEWALRKCQFQEIPPTDSALIRAMRERRTINAALTTEAPKAPAEATNA